MYRAWPSPSLALSRSPKFQNSGLLFNEAGFADFATDTVRHAFVLPSFDAYYGPFERGGVPPVRRWSAFPRKYAVRYAKRRGAIWVTPAGRSSRKPSTELPVDGAKVNVRTLRN